MKPSAAIAENWGDFLAAFDGFARPAALTFGVRQAREVWRRTSGRDEPPVAEAHCWLLRIGYQRAGPFDSDDEPRRA